MILTIIAVDATPDHERNLRGRWQEEVAHFFGDLIPYSNVTHRTDSNPGLHP